MQLSSGESLADAYRHLRAVGGDGKGVKQQFSPELHAVCAHHHAHANSQCMVAFNVQTQSLIFEPGHPVALLHPFHF